MTKDEKIAAVDILKYIQKQPNVKHTAEGIAKYWIYQQRLEENLDTVISAIAYLVQRGFLIEENEISETSFYKVNKDKIVEIETTLKKLQEKL